MDNYWKDRRKIEELAKKCNKNLEKICRSNIKELEKGLKTIFAKLCK